MVRKRDLSDEEKTIWKELVRGVLPLKKSVKPKEILASKAAEKIIVSSNKPKKKIYASASKEMAITPAKSRKDVKQGDYANIDKNTAEKFRKGEAKIDAKLDLHGMTSEKAHSAFVAFIHKQAKLERRNLLVITGKGSGILRSSLPKWISTPDLQPLILAFDSAKDKHGGAGAYYILLRRKRGSS